MHPGIQKVEAKIISMFCFYSDNLFCSPNAASKGFQTDLWHEWFVALVIVSTVSVGFQGILMCIEGTECEIDFTRYFMFQETDNMFVLEIVGNLKQDWESACWW